MAATMNGTEPKKILGIPCGCGNRKDIMGAGEWQKDAIILALVIGIPIGIYAYQKWGR